MSISPSFNTALVDGDILVYRVAWASENEPEGIARARLDELFDRIMLGTSAEKALVFLTSDDQSNFRFKLFPDYKANRKDKPKPQHYKFLREYLKDHYLATEVFNQEADDAIGIAAGHEKDSIICTIDKDLDCIPGWHFNFVKDEIYNVDELSAIRWFYHQCLEGDKATDNIEGCRGIGKVKAARMLEGCENEEEMFQTVLQAYEKVYPVNEAHDRFLLAGSLLWIRREPDQPWVLNGSPVSKETLQRYSTSTELSTNTSPTESST